MAENTAGTGFRHFGTMIDCSRNAVMTVDTLKKWIDLTADLGYNTLMLYTEDTYEIPGEPYFGYMRGRYTEKELKEVDDYAAEKGMELIPCIQTLAHLNAIVRWPAYREHVDTDDILLAGDEAVYHLIDKMFRTISRTFRSRTVNIGMDEAHMIGRGKYQDLHGYEDRTEIFLTHIRKVAELGKKYGLELLIWSDMFFRLASGGSYYDSQIRLDKSVKKLIPDNVGLVYWDYYSADRKRYANMLKAHRAIKSGSWFAGGLWSWSGPVPHNAFSIRCNKAAIESCREAGVEDVFLTLWGDDGNACSRFATLPALFHAAEVAKGNTDEELIRARFQEKFGISFERFMLLDLPGTPGYSESEIFNPEKYLLYNDPFTGLLDSTLTGSEGEQYGVAARLLKYQKDQGEWSYIFETLHDLAAVLQLKAELGNRTRLVYKSRSKEALKALIADYDVLNRRLRHFHKTFQRQWFKENKPHGFDVMDIRLGGLIQRVTSCRERLKALLDDEITRIDELEETRLDYNGNETFFEGKPIEMNNWRRTVSANVVDW